VGVLGTPVADTSTKTLYLVAESQVGSTGTPGEPCTGKNLPQGWVHRLHALDISSPTNFKSGNEKWGGPIQVKSEMSGQATFSSEYLIQRPGLLLDYQGTTYPTLYMAFSMMDTNSSRPSGWVYAYDAWSLASTSFPLYYATAPDIPPLSNPGSGVWQGGAGLASGSDENGGNYLYLSTANGDYDLVQGGKDEGDTFLKLNPNLTVAAQFTPSDEYWRECNGNDMDYGSAGTLLLPDTLFSGSEYAVKADKENYLWVIDRTSPGGFTGGNCTTGVPPICTLSCQSGCNPCTASNNLPETPVAIGTQHGTSPPFSRAAPAFWNGSVNGDAGELYYAIPAGQLQRYPVVTGSCSSPNTGYPPVCNAEATGNDNIISDHTGYSATPSVSSFYTQGSYTNGIAWLVRSEGSASGCSNYAILEAYNAGNANSLDEIYNSYNTNGRDYGACVGCGTKFSVPTVANGYVFVGTQSALNIFGLNPNQPQQSCTK